MNLLQIALLAGYLTGIIWMFNMVKSIPLPERVEKYKGWRILGYIIGALFWPICFAVGFVLAWRDNIQNR